MDTIAIAERLVQIRKCLRVLRELQPMTYEEFAGNYLDFEVYTRYIGAWVAPDAGEPGEG